VRKEGGREQRPTKNDVAFFSAAPLPPPFPPPPSPHPSFSSFSFFRRAERVSRADTTLHPYIIIFPPCQPFRRRRRPVRFHVSLLPLSPWKPCGSYATFGPDARRDAGAGMMSTMEKVKEERRAGSAGEDTVPERDLDAIFKSGATSILPPFPLSLSLSFSFRLFPQLLFLLSPSAILEPEDAGYRNTALNRPRGLTLTRDHPLVRRGLPCRFL